MFYFTVNGYQQIFEKSTQILFFFFKSSAIKFDHCIGFRLAQLVTLLFIFFCYCFTVAAPDGFQIRKEFENFLKEHLGDHPSERRYTEVKRKLEDTKDSRLRNVDSSLREDYYRYLIILKIELWFYYLTNNVFKFISEIG